VQAEILQVTDELQTYTLMPFLFPAKTDHNEGSLTDTDQHECSIHK